MHLLPRAGGVAISIHALLAESDQAVAVTGGQTAKFLSTLSLRRATLDFSYILHLQAFLSTLSLRRATAVQKGHAAIGHDFYPRSPCGERRGNPRCCFCRFCISIHALLAESDVGCRFTTSGCSNFYPRSPCGERLVQQLFDFALCLNFYPRSPCGERHFLPGNRAVFHQFPRSPCGERHTFPAALAHLLGISIHALLAESDRMLRRMRGTK